MHPRRFDGSGQNSTIDRPDLDPDQSTPLYAQETIFTESHHHHPAVSGPKLGKRDRKMADPRETEPPGRDGPEIQSRKNHPIFRGWGLANITHLL